MSPIITDESHTLVHLKKMKREPAAIPGMPAGPLTVIEQGHITFEQMAERIIRTRQQHGELLQRFHEVWYECGHTWVYTHVLGVGTMKSPNDLWAYHDIMFQHRPQTVIECGTYQGGSALWFAFLMDMLQIDGKVLTIDIEDNRQCDHPRISYLAGDSTDPELAAAVISEISGPLLVVLDSDHSAAHVRKELDLYAPACQVGDWLVVEDTNIGWTDTKIQIGDEIQSIGGDRGARGGLEDYLTTHSGEFRQDVLSERWLLTMHPGGFLQRVGACTHG
jgi:cephalosporin hydroxylase